MAGSLCGPGFHHQINHSDRVKKLRSDEHLIQLGS